MMAQPPCGDGCKRSSWQRNLQEQQIHVRNTKNTTEADNLLLAHGCVLLARRCNAGSTTEVMWPLLQVPLSGLSVRQLLLRLLLLCVPAEHGSV
jgi:hypothetical protein